MAIRRIAILGAGNGGCAAAADLALKGYEVRLYSRSESTLKPILERGGVTVVEGKNRSFGRLGVVTRDIGDAVAGVDLIMMTVPSVGHEYLGKKLAPHLSEEQILLLNPGHTGGSLHLASVLSGAGLKAKIKICETVTLTYICRLTGPARLEIFRRTAHLRCAAFPGKFGSEIVAEIAKIYPNIVPAENVLETGLCNINAIMHPAGMIGNAGRIERSQGDFYFYRDGITLGIANIIAAVDQERLRIVKTVGLSPLSFVEIFYQAGLTTEAARSSGSIYRVIRESPPNRTIKSPKTLDHRYLHEDVGYGLVPMAEIAKLVGVETPVIDGLIAVASEMNSIHYRREGLTLDRMGLSQVKAEDLSTLLQEGF
jgi:opine dehydrogenase